MEIEVPGSVGWATAVAIAAAAVSLIFAHWPEIEAELRNG